MDKPRNDERFGGQGRENGHAGDRPNMAPRPWRGEGRRDTRRMDEGWRGDRPNPRNEYAGLGAGFGAGGFNRGEWQGEDGDREDRFGGGEPRFGREHRPQHQPHHQDDRWAREHARHQERHQGSDDRWSRDDRWHQDERRFDDARLEEHPLRYRDDGPDRSTYEHRFDEPLRYRDEPDRFGDGRQRQQYSYSPGGDYGATGQHGVAGATFGAQPRDAFDRHQMQPRGQWHEGQDPRRDQRGQEDRGGWWQREPLTASEIMTPNVKTVTRDASIKDVAVIMRSENVGAVPVCEEDGRLTGIVTDRDIVVRGLMGDRAVGEMRVEHVMTDDVEAVHPDDSVHDVIELMGRKQVRRMPVVDENQRLLGIVSLGDVANRADYDEELQNALEKISSKRSFWSRLWR